MTTIVDCELLVEWNRRREVEGDDNYRDWLSNPAPHICEAILRSFDDPEPGVPKVNPLPTAPKKLTGKKKAFIPSDCPHSFDDPEPGVPEAKPVSTAPKKLTGQKKAFISSNCPRNKAQRECYKFAKTPSMYGYINLPTGCPTKMSRSDLSASITAGSPHYASATKASSVRVKCVKTSTCGKYNKNDDGGARHA
jgi:hypothetical protein